MNRKNKSIITLTTVVAIAATFVFGYGIPIGGQGMSHSTIQILDVDELAGRSNLIVVGNVVSDRTIASPSETYPAVQVTNLLIHEVLKGTYTNTHVELRDFGTGAVVKNGIRYDATSGSASPTYAQNERVLVFLEYDAGNELGDGYYVLSSAFGKYEIDGILAKNLDPTRNQNVTDIKQIIRSALM